MTGENLRWLIGSVVTVVFSVIGTGVALGVLMMSLVNGIHTAADRRVDDLQKATDSRVEDVQTNVRGRVDDLQTATDSRVGDVQTATDSRIQDLQKAMTSSIGLLDGSISRNIRDLQTVMTDNVHALRTEVTSLREDMTGVSERLARLRLLGNSPRFRPCAGPALPGGKLRPTSV